MARPRKITDERLLTAAGVAIGRLGPAFTLADVAREAEVAAGTLVQRFGSKHGLLVAVTTAAIDGLRKGMAARVAHTAGPADIACPADSAEPANLAEPANPAEPVDPAGPVDPDGQADLRHPAGPPDAAEAVEAVVDAVVGTYAPLDDPSTAANNLAQLAYDLADAELRGLMADFYAAMEAGLCALLERAVEAGALRGAPPSPVAARILAATADGTALHWSARPEGGLRDRLRADVGAVLGGWRHESPVRVGESS